MRAVLALRGKYTHTHEEKERLSRRKLASSLSYSDDSAFYPPPLIRRQFFGRNCALKTTISITWCGVNKTRETHEHHKNKRETKFSFQTRRKCLFKKRGRIDTIGKKGQVKLKSLNKSSNKEFPNDGKLGWINDNSNGSLWCNASRDVSLRCESRENDWQMDSLWENLGVK